MKLKITLLLVILLLSVFLHATMAHTMLGALDYGNTIIARVMSISDNNYVSLNGPISHVFSLTESSLTVMQTIHSSDRYANVTKGDGNLYFAMTIFCTLDIYFYDNTEGLHLISSTDLHDPLADESFHSVSICLSVADGYLIFENDSLDFDGTEWFCRSIVDVHNPQSPLLVSREYVDTNEWYKGFFHINNSFYYLSNIGRLRVSVVPTQFPDIIEIPGLESYTIQYTKQIDDNIYIVCKDSLDVWNIARLSIPLEGTPSLSIAQSVDLTGGFELTDNVADNICLTGYNSAGNWSIRSYTYTATGEWLPGYAASFDSSYYRLFHRSGGFFAAGSFRSLLLGNDLTQNTVINVAVSYIIDDIILNRYLILSASDSSSHSSGHRIFDLQNEVMLDFQTSGDYNLSIQRYGRNRIIFQSSNIEIVELGNNGITRTWSIPPPSGISQTDVNGNLLALSGFVNGQWRVYMYTLSENGAQLQSETIVPHICASLSFYEQDHLIISRYTTNDVQYMFFYRIAPDYSLTNVHELITSGIVLFIMPDKIIQPYDGGEVIDTSDPDNPMPILTLDIPTYGGWGCSFDGSRHYMIQDLFHAFVLDADFQLRGYLAGITLQFYERGKYLNSGSGGVAELQIDSIVEVDDQEFPSPDTSIQITAFPNPMLSNGKVTGVSIEFSLATKPNSPPIIDIYNIRGQKVKTILMSDNDHVKILATGRSKGDKQSRNLYSTTWNAKDDHNRALASGIYIVRVVVDDSLSYAKVTVIK